MSCAVVATRADRGPVDPIFMPTIQEEETKKCVYTNRLQIYPGLPTGISRLNASTTRVPFNGKAPSGPILLTEKKRIPWNS